MEPVTAPVHLTRDGSLSLSGRAMGHDGPGPSWRSLHRDRLARLTCPVLDPGSAAPVAGLVQRLASWTL